MCMHCANTHLKISSGSKETGYNGNMSHTVSYCHLWTHTRTHIYASPWWDLCNICRWMSQRFVVLSSP